MSMSKPRILSTLLPQLSTDIEVLPVEFRGIFRIAAPHLQEIVV